MPVEMIGWISPRVSSEVQPPQGPPFNADVIAETARIHEAAGFDRVLIGYFSDAPDGFVIGAHAASVTDRLGFLLAHRPGFVAPTLAARKLATLDQLSGGRVILGVGIGWMKDEFDVLGVPFQEREVFRGIYPMEKGLALLYEVSGPVELTPAEAAEVT